MAYVPEESFSAEGGVRGDTGTFIISRFFTDEFETWRVNIIIENNAVSPPQELWNQSIWLHPTAREANDRMSRQPLEPSTGSASSLRQIRAWMDDCDKNHASCSRRNNANRMTPTRLVAIFLDHERIVQSSSLKEDPDKPLRYATLSHCWGKIPMFTLQHANIAEMQTRIPRGKLTKTFLDAIDATRRLGLKYIWIDSLCIVQDDTVDWSHEAELMSDIYSGSSLTIAATSAQDGTVGCYRTRNPDAVTAQALTLSNASGESQSFDVYNFDMYSQGVLSSPLISRGWVLQERFLSPRTVHFTANQLFWECGERFACESFTDEIPAPLATRHAWFRKRWDNPNVWTDTVRQYSRCLLTHDGDKLIAMQGVARCLMERMKCGYVYGLWERDMENQLLWRVKGGRAEYYCLSGRDVPPSWSWASLNGQVEWPLWGGVELGNSLLVSKIIGYGNSGGRMTLRLRSKPGLRRLDLEDILDKSDIHEKVSLMLYHDCEASNGDAGTSSEELDRVWALPLTVRAPRRGNECFAAGLIVKERSDGVFSRAGMFLVSDAAPRFTSASPVLLVGEVETTFEII